MVTKPTSLWGYLSHWTLTLSYNLLGDRHQGGKWDTHAILKVKAEERALRRKTSPETRGSRGSKHLEHYS